MSIDQRRLDSFLARVVGDLAASYGGIMVSLGRKLGLYEAMAGAGPLASVEVARRTGTAERYVREWLNSQAAAGYLTYHADGGAYELGSEEAEVLANTQSPVYMPPAWEVPASMWSDEEQTLDAFRTGRGVPWGAHDERLFCGVAAF